MPDPQITDIAGYFASHLPTDDIDPAENKEAWRATLRRARRTGAIGWLTDLVEREAPEDETLKEHCDALRR